MGWRRSVFPTLIAEGPGWGRAIQKVEYGDHACKCYRASLEKLVQQNHTYEGRAGLTGKMRQRLSAARCAIKMCSELSSYGIQKEGNKLQPQEAHTLYGVINENT